MLTVPVPITYVDLGSIDYQSAWDLQERLLSRVIDAKMENRMRVREGKSPGSQPPGYLLFCEHPHVYTLGRSGDAANLLLNQVQLRALGAQYFPINRGGDITYHGPGQIVGYPILDLDQFFTDVHRYVRYLEEAIILTLREYGITANRQEGYTGVWIDGSPKRKICAIGVHLKRWVTMHGFAFNVNTDLTYFSHIVPCGISDDDKTVTSLARELGKPVDIRQVSDILKTHLSNLFGFDLREEPLPSLVEKK